MGECRLVRGRGAYRGKQGLEYFEGVSAESAGATGLCLHRLVLPPGARAEPHLHEEHESAVYVLSGEAVMWHGERLEQRMDIRAGDFVYIPAGVPHLPANPSESEPVVAVIARTDPSEQESVLLRPDLLDVPLR
ncbi:MAG TPA: cupin domain-containing protein [Gaiellaceae bacterium]|nr:cupin domain-containing protein [Gaiellaceae bacterium]